MLNIQILSAQECLYKGDILAAFFPSKEGEFEVLPYHGSMIALLSKGDIRLRLSDSEKRISISSGVMRVENDTIIACIEKI